NKFESQEICFVPSNNYRDVVSKYANGFEFVQEGDIVFRGVVIGKHKGYINYTIGQRKGLGVSYSKPLYVKNIYPETNTIEVDVEEGLCSRRLYASNANFMKSEYFVENKPYLVKIRYKDKGSLAYCKITPSGQLCVDFIEPKKAITPGQSVVVYDDEDLVAGGVIDASE
ncbi:MAG: tRNA methyl transferase PRC-barrel domain-containing protein, partial [Candidatus Kapaibacteriota bacterium]